MNSVPSHVLEAFAEFMKTLDHPHQWYGGRTYAQHGDDLAIINLFKCLRIDLPSYIDVGAHHPFHLSNTALLYARGSRGINVEANPALIGEFKRLRPEDINVCVAVVGPRRQTSARLNRINETSGINSLLPIDEKQHVAIESIEVPACTIDDIVTKFADGVWPDLLTIDIEGMDIPVLKSINFARGGPKVICAEFVSQLGDVSAELRELMSLHGYTVHSFVGSNMLFVQDELIGMCR